MTCKIPLVAESHGLCRVDGEQFLSGIRNSDQQRSLRTNLHVEDLDAVVDGLTSDDHEVVLATDLVTVSIKARLVNFFNVPRAMCWA